MGVGEGGKYELKIKALAGLLLIALLFYRPCNFLVGGEGMSFSISIEKNGILRGQGNEGEVLEGIVVDGNGSAYLQDSDNNSWYTEYYGDSRRGLLRIHKDLIEEWYYSDSNLWRVPTFNSDSFSSDHLTIGQKSDLYQFLDTELRVFCYNSVLRSHSWYYDGKIVAKVREGEAPEVLYSPDSSLNSILFRSLLDNIEDSKRVDDHFIVKSRVGCVAIKLTFQVEGYCYKAEFTDELKEMTNLLRVDLDTGYGFLGSRWLIEMNDETTGRLFPFENYPSPREGYPFKFVFKDSPYNGSLTLSSFYSDVCRMGNLIVNDWWQIKGDVNDDGSVNVLDLMLMKSASLGEMELSTKQRINADLNDNKELDTMDVLSLKKLIIGM